MSRSFKHTPVYKGDKDRSAKKYANRRVRRNGKIKHGDIKAGKSKHYKKLNESWHICDYRTWVNRYGEENLVKIFQIGQKFGGNAIEVSK